MSYSYYAFISYSRKDKAAARYLQSKLENYRYPITLVTDIYRPDNPMFLRKIFRDTSDLDVTHSNFTEAIDRHIAESRYLIVLCSPNASSSIWVDREIKCFLETHDNNMKNIFPVILNGEVPDCLPESLRIPEFLNRNIPTMIPDDVSSQKDGWEHGFLQLVGALLNVSISKITDRFQKAKQAALMRVIFIISAALLAAIGLTIWALTAEHKARTAEKKARHESEIAKETLTVIKKAFAAADAKKSGRKEATLLEFAQDFSAELKRIKLPEVRLNVAVISIPLISNMGDPQSALKYFTPLISEAGKIFPPDSQKMFEFRMAHAQILLANQKNSQALKTYLELLQKIKKDTPDKAALLNKTGLAYALNGYPYMPLKCYMQALEIQQKTHGKDHQDTAETLSNIAKTYSTLGKLKKSLEYSIQALKIQRKTFGENHPVTADTLKNIGHVYSHNKMRDYDNAVRYYSLALNILREKLGDDHPDVAGTMNNIGRAYWMSKNYDKALDYFQQQLAIDQKIFGREHPRVMNVLDLIGRVYRSDKNYDKAVEYFLKLSEIRKKLNRKDLKNTLCKIADIYLEKKDFHNAIEYYRKVTVQKNINDTPDILQINSQSKMGYSLVMIGNTKTGFELLDHALDALIKKYGADHLSTVTAYYFSGLSHSEIARQKRSQDNYDQAEKFLKTALRISSKKYGKNHPFLRRIAQDMEQLKKIRKDF